MYCTIADILSALPKDNVLQLTDDEQSNTAEITEESDAGKRILDAIKRAEATVNSYFDAGCLEAIADHYDESDEDIELLRNFTIDLTLHALWKRQDPDGYPDGVRANYDNTIAELTRLQKIRFCPVAVDPPDPINCGSSATFVTNRRRRRFRN